MKSQTLLLLFLSFIPVIYGQDKTREVPEDGYKYWNRYAPCKIEDINCQNWIPHDNTIQGWDWSLPDTTTVSKTSMYSMARINSLEDPTPEPCQLSFQANPVCEMWITWEELEPTEGQYNWDKVSAKIKEIKDAGYEVFFRPLFSAKMRGENPEDWGYTPEWLDRYNLPYTPANGKGANLAYYDPSDPVFHEKYIRIIRSMGETDIPDLVKGAYVGYASPSHGDEGIGPEGQDPDTVRHVIERLDAWADTFKGQTGKVYMGGVSDYGMSKGFGIRRGFVEMYWYHIPDRVIGQYVDRNGYLCVDESVPVIRDRSFNGEENEEYSPVWASAKKGFRFGKSTVSFPYRYFMSMLRSLQMRCNAMMSGVHVIPAMVPFVSMEMGRTIEDTPDVWSFMCETNLKASLFAADHMQNPDNTKSINDKDRKDGVRVKNMERWLYQRDSPGYETEPAVRIEHPIMMWMMQPGKYYDYIARTGKRIGFDIDGRFATGNSVAIKVTYIDNANGELVLKYKSADKSIHYRRSALSGDGKLKTATFFLDDFSKKEKEGAYDFTIEAGCKTEAVTVSMVRVIKR